MLLLDNFDSFTYNLVESISKTSYVQCRVMTPKAFLEDISIAEFDGIIISPGPGLPDDSDSLIEILDQQMGRIPIFGICLGLQALVMTGGGKLRQLEAPLHGRSSTLKILDSRDLLYKGLKDSVTVGHYHSWYVAPEDCPEMFIVTALDAKGRVMSIRHKADKIWAVQYHPESFLCPKGDQIIGNFLSLL
ncbi:MAG: aminodeoxychorismate/anthranilate synthase component II [Bacteroidetes bacterium]|nr:aminodeoxychorismate/anthranilate synthase component II [Bacteroidota bacterium]